VTLETWDTPDQLYSARREEINPLRPLFTGDVFEDVEIPGVQAGGMAIVVAHPCSMRGREARLEPGILTAAMTAGGSVGKSAWAKGHFGLMPLPDLVEPGRLCVAELDDIGKASTQRLLESPRIACLSPYGVNLLQQRFIWRLTRFEVPTHKLHEASVHVFEEADLLEEWCDEVCASAASLRRKPPPSSRRSYGLTEAAGGRCRTT